MQRNEIKAAAKGILSELPLPKTRRLKRNDFVTLGLSLVLALILWVYIASIIAPDFSVEFRDLPVTVDLTGTRAQQYDLDILPESQSAAADLKVSCTIYGTRASLGGLKRADCEVYIDFDEVSDIIGIQKLPVKFRTKNGAEFTKADLKIKGVTITDFDMKLDRFETRTVEVNQAIYPYLVVDDETHVQTDDITYEPSTVEIKGPSSTLKNISHIRVNISDSTELNETATFTDCTDYSIIKTDGTPMTETVNAGLTVLTSTRFSVRIPVSYSKELPLSVNIPNVPANFDVDMVLKHLRIIANGKEFSLPGYGDDTLNITIETTEPEMKEKLDVLDTYYFYNVNLSELTPGEVSKPLEIPMKEGFTDIKNIGQVYIKLDDTDLTTKTMQIKNSDIIGINGDKRYEYAKKYPDGITQITLVGMQEELDKIEAKDLKASVNLLDADIKPGVDTLEFTVTLPDAVNGVWVSPSPEIDIVVKEAET